MLLEAYFLKLQFKLQLSKISWKNKEQVSDQEEIFKSG